MAATAERALDRLPTKVAAATVELTLGPLIEAPRRVGHPLKREPAGLRPARRGAYGIAYQLDEDERVVEIVRIDHRSDVCRPR